MECPRCEGSRIDPEQDERNIYRYAGVIEPGSLEPCALCDGTGEVKG